MPKPWHLETSRIRIRKVCVGPYENNAYVIACTETGEGVLIDAAAETERLIAETNDVAVVALLTTHGHLDHISAAKTTAAALDIPFLLDPADIEIAGLDPDGSLPNESMFVGNLHINMLSTPGHTPGSTCFATEGILFSGDTLFPGGPGATHFPYSDFDQIMESIETQLLTLDDATLVLPGHGLDTTIGDERPAVPNWRKRRW